MTRHMRSVAAAVRQNRFQREQPDAAYTEEIKRFKQLQRELYGDDGADDWLVVFLSFFACGYMCLILWFLKYSGSAVSPASARSVYIT